MLEVYKAALRFIGGEAGPATRRQQVLVYLLA